MGSTTIIRGFKVSVAALDAFLAANSVDETYGGPPFYGKHPDEDPISKLPFSKVSQHDPDEGKLGVYLVVTYDICGYYGEEMHSSEGL